MFLGGPGFFSRFLRVIFVFVLLFFVCFCCFVCSVLLFLEGGCIVYSGLLLNFSIYVYMYKNTIYSRKNNNMYFKCKCSLIIQFS